MDNKIHWSKPIETSCQAKIMSKSLMGTVGLYKHNHLKPCRESLRTYLQFLLTYWRCSMFVRHLMNTLDGNIMFIKLICFHFIDVVCVRMKKKQKTYFSLHVISEIQTFCKAASKMKTWSHFGRPRRSF